MIKRPTTFTLAVAVAVLVLGAAGALNSQSLTAFTARDPGVRSGDAGAGDHLAGLTTREIEFFDVGKEDFEEAEEVDEGLGPTMNLDGCGGCHSQPAIGGTSPAVNPQVAFARKTARTTSVADVHHGSTARCARRASCGIPTARRDGGVHALFTISGRDDAPGCNLAQADFAGESRAAT